MKTKKGTKFEVITIFPNIFDSYMNESLIKKAKEKKIISVNVHNLRDFADDRHDKVDDKPFGGGPGMVIKVGPVHRAVESIKSKVKSKKLKVRTILFSLRGKKLDNVIAKRLSKYDNLILICGRYEGVDERVAEHVADEEISIGDYVLAGGELPAMVLIEAVSRHIEGFLGKTESLEEIKGSHPAYTRPESYVPKKGAKPWKIPEVLTSGNHAKIEAWRKGK